MNWFTRLFNGSIIDEHKKEKSHQEATPWEELTDNQQERRLELESYASSTAHYEAIISWDSWKFPLDKPTQRRSNER